VIVGFESEIGDGFADADADADAVGVIVCIGFLVGVGISVGRGLGEFETGICALIGDWSGLGWMLDVASLGAVSIVADNTWGGTFFSGRAETSSTALLKIGTFDCGISVWTARDNARIPNSM
jgi:hypothetical protein